MSTKEINETREKIQSLIETLRKIKYVKNPIVKKDDTIHELNRILLRLKDDDVRQDPTLVQNLSMQSEKIFRESLAQELYVIQNAELNNYNAHQVVILQAALAAQLITEQQLRNAIAIRNQRIAQLEADLANERARIQQLTNNLAQRNADIAALNQQVQQLTADVQAKDAQIAAHQNQIRLIENQLRNIKLAREHFRQVAQQETLRANQAEQKVNQAEQKVNQAEQKVNQAEQKVNQLAIANQGLANQLEQKTTEFEHLEGAFQYRENEYKALDQAYDLIVREVKQMEADLQGRIQELNTANQQNEQLQQSLNLKDGELQAKEQELKQLELELKKLEQQLAQITKAFTDSQEDKRRVHEEKFHLEKRIKFLEQERNRLLKDFTDMTQTANELKDQVIDKEKELAKQKKFYQDKLFAEQDRYETLNQEYQKLRTSDQGNLQAMADQKALITELKQNLMKQKNELTKKQKLINELQTQAKQEQITAQELQAKIQELENLNSKQAAELKQVSKEKAQLESQITELEQEIKTNTARLVESNKQYEELGQMYDDNVKDYQSLLSEIKALTNGQEYQFKTPIFGQLAQLLKKVEGSSIEDKIAWFGQQIGLIGSLKKRVTDQKNMIDELQSNQGQNASLAEQEMSVIEAELEEKQKEVTLLQKELKEITDNKSRQDYDLTRLHQQVLQQQGDIASLRKQLEESKAKELKLRNLESNYPDIKKQLDAAEQLLKNKQEMLDAHAQLRQSATKRMEENQHLKRQILELEIELNRKEADYQSNLDLLQFQLAELSKIVQEDKDIQRKQELELRAQKQQFEFERKQAKQKLDKEMQELDVLLKEATSKAKQKNDELLAHQDLHIKKMKALLDKNSLLEKELNIIKERDSQLIKKIREVISDVKFDVPDIDTAIDNFIVEYQKLAKISAEQKQQIEKQTEELKTQAEQLKARQSDEQSKVNVTSEELNTLQEKIKEQQKQIETLEDEKQNLTRANQKLEQNNSDLQKANLELQQTLNETLSFLEISRSEEKELKIHSAALLDRMNKLERDMFVLRDKNSELEDKNAEYSGQDKNNLYKMMENINVLTGQINGFNSYNNNIAYLKQSAGQLLTSPNLTDDDKTWLRSTIANLPDQINSDSNLESTMLKLQNAITGTLDIMSKVKDYEYNQDQKINRNIVQPISDMINDFASLVEMRKNMLSNYTYYLEGIHNIRNDISNPGEAWRQYMKLKAEFENEMDNKNIALQKELRQVQAENKYHLDMTSTLQTEIFNINLEMQKIQKQQEKIENQRQTLITKLESLRNTFKQFGSSTMENLVEINKKLQELRNNDNDKIISEIQGSIIKIQNQYRDIMPSLRKRDQATSKTNDQMPELEYGMPNLEYQGRGESLARKSVKGGHDPSQIQQVQQVTGLAAIFGAFGILRFLMYAIIVVVLIVMVWHLFSSWRQEQSCRPYLADIYGLENEYYNHYIYS